MDLTLHSFRLKLCSATIYLKKNIVQCTVYSVQCTVYSVHCPVFSVQCSVYSVQCTLYIVQCTVYNVQCIMYSVQCTLYSILFTDTLFSDNVREAVLLILWREPQCSPV